MKTTNILCCPRQLVVLVLVSALTLACSSDPRQLRDERLARGDRFVAENKLAEAIVEYRSAVQADPQSGVARQKLGNALFETKDYERAFGELVRAADLLPDDLTAQLRAAQTLLLLGQFEDARVRAERVLVRVPNNVPALIVTGNALAGLRDFEHAIAEITKAIEADPTNGDGYSHLGAMRQAEGKRAEAEDAFKRAVDVDPKSTQARLALANLYWSTGRHREAEDQLKAAAQMDPGNLLPHRGLALLYLGSGRHAEAEAPLKAYAEKAPGYEGKLYLADYYVNRRRMPEAQAIYETLVSSSGPAVQVAKLRLAALGLNRGDREGAYRLVQEVLAKDGNNIEGLIAQAQLQFREGKVEDALATARKAGSTGGTHPAPHFVLGRILKATGQLEDAEAAFKESVRLSPRFAPGNVELARLMIVAGRYPEAVTHAQAAIDAVPTLGDSYLLLARAQIAVGNAPAAQKALAIMSTNFPDSPIVHAEIGLLRMAQSDLYGAAASFEKALAKDPTLAVAIEGLTNIDLRQGRPGPARSRLDRLVSSAPNNAELQLVAARFYAGPLADVPAAEVAVKRAVAAEPNSMAAYEVLGRVYATRGDLEAATTEFENIARRQPRSVQTHTTVGILYQLQNKYDEARAAYERALVLDAGAGVAANNLAGLYVDRGDQLDIALQLARTAKASLPKSHEVDDTLGWVYYKKGHAAQAVQALRTAVAAQPDNPVYLYHLGAAYALAQDTANAKLTLGKLLQRQQSFDGADDARRILASVK